jgi:hypothetical protein
MHCFHRVASSFLASRQGLLAAPVGAPLLGQGDALALALPDQVALELGDGAQDRQDELGHRRILAGKRQVLLHELQAQTSFRLLLDDAAQVIVA